MVHFISETHFDNSEMFWPVIIGLSCYLYFCKVIIGESSIDSLFGFTILFMHDTIIIKSINFKCTQANAVFIAFAPGGSPRLWLCGIVAGLWQRRREHLLWGHLHWVTHCFVSLYTLNTLDNVSVPLGARCHWACNEQIQWQREDGFSGQI